MPSSEPPLWAQLVELHGYLTPRRRMHLYVLFALMLAGAIAELATIGSLMPFLSLLAGVDRPERAPSLAKVFAIAGATSPREQVWTAAALFAAIALIAGAVRITLSWSMQMFTAMLGHELSVDVQSRVLAQPYIYHLTHNSSEAISAMDRVQSLVVHVLLQLIYAFAATLIGLVIIAALIYLQPLTATVAALGFSIIYLLVSLGTRPRLLRNSRLIGTTYEERVTIVQESIGGIRDVIIDGTQRIYLRAFSNVSRRYNLAAATTSFMATTPRFVVEAVGMAGIAAVAVIISNRQGGISHALPLLGAIALGAQRLLPLLQQVYHGWASVSGHRSSVTEVLELLRLPAPAEPLDMTSIRPLPLRRQISLEGVSFAYPGTQSIVLEDISLKIQSGSVVGFTGRTGSGKSTLADLIMGLIEPTEGQVTVDGVRLEGMDRLRWLRSIAHVPQSVFLGDTTIARNIAFGIEPQDIDDERVRAAAATAQLHEFILSLPEGYETSVGERGIRLSGGQRQRLGIARAIYKQSPVLVLDEATSALDEATEAAVMDSLSALIEEGRTIIVIAHRMSTLASCEQLVRIENRRVAVTGANEELTALRRH